MSFVYSSYLKVASENNCKTFDMAISINLVDLQTINPYWLWVLFWQPFQNDVSANETSKHL